MFELHCQSYPDQGIIPLGFAHDSVPGGKNISPGFSWSDPPHVTKSFALSIVDPHPVAKNWVHWLVVNISFRERKIPEGASRTDLLPRGSLELYNSYSIPGYGGPAPPPGSGPHPYVATLYALNTDLLKTGRNPSLREFLRLLEGRVIEERTLTGFFEQGTDSR